MEIDLSQPAPKAKTLEEAQQIIDVLWELLRQQQSSMAELQKKVADLEEKTRTNSKNSSTTPSQDTYRKKRSSRRKTSNKRGGQKGRQGVGVYHTGVEPTNNLAERTIRHYVMWRRLCLSFQSKRGSLYAQRMMTVVGSCKLQGRNVMDFMTQAINAHYGKGNRPALV